jgi:hypothetical protein
MSITNKLFKTIRSINLPFDNSNEDSKYLEMQKINNLLYRDYEKIGFQDSIYEPSQASIELKLERFKLQLLNEYQILIDKRNERLTKLTKLHLSTSNIDELLSEKLKTDIDILKYDIENLIRDSQLIESREGKFKIIENSYKIGYTTGIISYKNAVILN